MFLHFRFNFSYLSYIQREISRKFILSHTTFFCTCSIYKTVRWEASFNLVQQENKSSNFMCTVNRWRRGQTKFNNTPQKIFHTPGISAQTINEFSMNTFLYSTFIILIAPTILFKSIRIIVPPTLYYYDVLGYSIHTWLHFYAATFTTCFSVFPSFRNRCD